MRGGASAPRLSWISISYKTNWFLQHFQATNNDTGQSIVSLHACGRFQSPTSNLMLPEHGMSCGHDLWPVGVCLRVATSEVCNVKEETCFSGELGVEQWRLLSRADSGREQRRRRSSRSRRKRRWVSCESMRNVSCHSSSVTFCVSGSMTKNVCQRWRRHTLLILFPNSWLVLAVAMFQEAASTN